MEYRYEPKGVCSYEMTIETEGDIIKKVTSRPISKSTRGNKYVSSRSLLQFATL